MQRVYPGEAVELMLSREEIAACILELAEEINRDYAGREVTFLCTLKGAVYFLADLTREITVPARVEFLKAASYGDDTKTSGTVRLEYSPDADIKGKHVILIEDIIDSGRTASILLKHVSSLDPASLKIAARLDKPSRREVPGIVPDYVGKTIEDKFVVGYGLDFAQKYRNLPYVGVLHFEK
jgi:hypoxanthine phosphoribosyltransferase